LTNHNEGQKFTAFRQQVVACLRNVSFLERPLHAITLQSAVQSAQRARDQQYEARAYLQAQQNSAAELERLVKARTAQLEDTNDRLRDEMSRNERTQAALLQAQKIETMGQLVGGVAHDFNNLLMAVIGNLDLLARRIGPDERLNRLLNGAMEGARRGAMLTQRLLAFARKQELQARATDAERLVEDIRDLIDRSVGPLVRLHVQPHRPLPAVTVDPNQLEMAVLNLAVNARDAMPLGGELTINLQAEELGELSDLSLPPGSYLRLSVRDTGDGMDAETLQRAVEPFYSTKGMGKGTGLGLSMVDGLANQSGGAFRLRSAPGKGTTAILWLPAAQGPAEVDVLEAAQLEHSEPATILLVDDDPLIAASTLALLEDLGHKVVEANSGPEALRIVEGGLRPDLVITDHAMPGMTGTELAALLRCKDPDLRILLATGYADLNPHQPSDLPRLAKPYTQDQLAREIARLL
jgi:signal transduction histidine kinase